jgi:hypothetical protein
LFLLCCCPGLVLAAEPAVIPQGIKPVRPGATDNASPNPAVVVNARDLGARGDGKTDDATAIQEAINRVARTGGRVLLPPSEHPYLVGRSLVIAGDNVELDGTGAAIQLADGASHTRPATEECDDHRGRDDATRREQGGRFLGHSREARQPSPGPESV